MGQKGLSDHYNNERQDLHFCMSLLRANLLTYRLSHVLNPLSIIGHLFVQF